MSKTGTITYDEAVREYLQQQREIMKKSNRARVLQQYVKEANLKQHIEEERLKSNEAIHKSEQQRMREMQLVTEDKKQELKRVRQTNSLHRQSHQQNMETAKKALMQKRTDVFVSLHEHSLRDSAAIKLQREMDLANKMENRRKADENMEQSRAKVQTYKQMRLQIIQKNVMNQIKELNHRHTQPKQLERVNMELEQLKSEACCHKKRVRLHFPPLTTEKPHNLAEQINKVLVKYGKYR